MNDSGDIVPAPFQPMVVPVAESWPIGVVGIGASAGGLAALSTLVSGLPVNTGLAFVIVQHLDPKWPSQLPEILGRLTKMPITEAIDGVFLAKDHVYIAPGHAALSLSHGYLKSFVPVATAKFPPFFTIDYFLEKIAHEYGHRGVGVILSGSGSDGAAGIKAIHLAGGITIVQDPIDAEFKSMPESAIKSNPDAVLKTNLIAGELARATASWNLNSTATTTTDSTATATSNANSRSGQAERELLKILGLIRTRRGANLERYKRPTLMRRTMRRMLAVGVRALADYFKYCELNPDEIDLLYEDILIKVTSFFRDKEVFDFLKDDLVPKIVKRTAEGEAIRVWVAGCATGEEAYSVAICFLEVMEELGQSHPMQIFATDISQSGLLKAREGIYPESIKDTVTEERLEKYFTRVHDKFKVKKHLHDLIIFSAHDMTKDAPFARMDFISSRNMLIYMNAVLQKKVLALIHVSLKTDGFLLLGTSETVGSAPGLFNEVNKTGSVYSRAFIAGPQPYSIEPYVATPKDLSRPSPQNETVVEDWVQIDADRAIGGKLGPLGVVIDGNLDILRFLGDTSGFLTHRSDEEASVNLARMTPLGLMSVLRVAIHQADVRDATVKNSVQKLTTDASKSLSLTFEVIPYRSSASKERHFVILFHQELAELASPLDQPGTDARSIQDQEHIRELEQSLSEARTYLNNLLESEQSANEELRAANEEIVASNEELQSTNEELQSAKEEIVASNDELQVVNVEMRHKNLALALLNRDYQNTLKSSSVAILMIKKDLKCRSMNSAAEKILGITDFRPGMELKKVIKRFVFPNLEDIIAHLDGTQEPMSVPLTDSAGHWYQWRIAPYFLDETHVEGAVIVISDIDLLKKTIAELEDTRRFNEAVLETAPMPLAVLDGDFKIFMANQSFGKMFEAGTQSSHGQSIFELNGGALNSEGFRDFLDGTLKTGRVMNNFVIDRPCGSSERRYLKISSERLSRQDIGGLMVLVAFDDLTGEKMAEERIRNALTSAERANRSKSEFLANVSHEFRSPLTAILGFTEVLSKDKTMSAGQHQYLMKVDANARHLTALIDEILDLSKIESGKFEINLGRINLPRELADTLGLLKTRADQKGVKFQVNLSSPIPEFINTSSLRLRQILLNIIGNAVKFTDHGSIRVTFGLTAHGLLSIVCHDTGPGLTPEQCERIFLPFGQADSSVTRKYGGSGLGLILSRHLAEALGGSVELTESRPGEGSTFTITIACGEIHETPMVTCLAESGWGRPTQLALPRAQLKNLSGIRVLLVEDSPDIREVLTLFIKSGGATVVTAQNGVEAVELANGGDFNIVLMDIQMPLMDGYEATRKLRACGYKIPILALTAHALTGEREKCIEAGCDDYITKPVMAHKLIEMISRFAVREPKN